MLPRTDITHIPQLGTDKLAMHDCSSVGCCRFDDWTAYGKIGGLDDPSMGWARYAQVTGYTASLSLTLETTVVSWAQVELLCWGLVHQ